MDDKTENRIEQILDGGDRTVFASGAVRDMHSGKGRCDLIPWDSVGFMINYDPAINAFLRFLKERDTADLRAAIMVYSRDQFGSIENALIELSKHFENGAAKYGAMNWQKGILASSYVDSGIRHYLKHKRGDIDERHDRACLWNWVCLLWTIENKPECNDLK